MDFWFSARRKPKVLSSDSSFGLTTHHWSKKTSSMRHFMSDWTRGLLRVFSKPLQPN